MEYVKDRLNAEIKRLEYKIIDMQIQHEIERNRAMVSEILLCILCGVIGYGLGTWLG